MDSLARLLLDLSPAGIILFQPLYDEEQTLIDFAYGLVNPVAQQLLQLPAKPAHTFRQLYPHADPTGIFTFYRDTFLSGSTAYYEVSYTYDGLDGYYHLAACREGERLVVTFTDAPERRQGDMAMALHLSYQREQQARAEAEAERQRLHAVLMQMPAHIALLRGPSHVYELVNPDYVQLFPTRAIIGRTIREVIPELAGQGFYELLDQVYQTGKPFYQEETEAWANFSDTGQLERRYYRTSLQPVYNAQGQVSEILNFAVDVTAQVETRQQIEQLNRQLVTAQAETEHQRQLLVHIFQQVPVPLAILRGEEYRLELLNATAAALWGLPVSSLLGQPVFKALPDLRDQGFDEILASVLQAGQPVALQEVPAVLNRAGTGRPALGYFNLSYQALRDQAEGPATGIVTVAIEVTEQVRARQQINLLNEQLTAATKEAERQRHELARILEQAPVAMAVYRGPEFVIELANATVCQLWGREAAHIIGLPLFTALPEVAGMGYEQLLTQVLTTGQPHVASAMEAQHDRNGRRETVYWDFVYVPMREEEGAISGVMVVATEVTAQVLARQQLEQFAHELEARVRQRTQELAAQQTLLERLFLAAPVPICILDGPDLMYQVVNPAYQQLFPGRQLRHLPFLQALPELRHDPLMDGLRQVYATGESLLIEEQALRVARYADGPLEELFFTFTYQARRDAAGVVNGLYIFAYDITDQVVARNWGESRARQLQEASTKLTRANEELTRVNAELDTFVYTASHDLKSPIANIEGLLTALRQELPAELLATPMVAQLLRLMDSSIARFLQTIGHLTDLTHLQQASTSLQEKVALATLVEGVCSDLALNLEAAHVQLTVDLDDCAQLPFVAKDLRAILFNLLSNAIKYRAPARQPIVQVQARCTEHQAVLTVKDNGLGLSDTQQQQLFGLFRRLHTHVEGSGVGLYSIKKLVGNAGGTITVQSELGTGSTFTVTLPR